MPTRSLHPYLASLSLVVFVLSLALGTHAWADGRFSHSSSSSSSSRRPRVDIDIDIGDGGGDGETPQKRRAVERLVRSADAMDLEIDGKVVVRKRGDKESLLIKANGFEPDLAVDIFLEGEGDMTDGGTSDGGTGDGGTDDGGTDDGGTDDGGTGDGGTGDGGGGDGGDTPGAGAQNGDTPNGGDEMTNGDVMLTAVASATANSLGQIFIKWDSRQHALPFDAESVVDLAGKQIVIATKDGMSLLEGTILDLMLEPRGGDDGSDDGGSDDSTDRKVNIRIVIEGSIDFEEALAKLRIKYRPSSDRSNMKMKCKKLSPEEMMVLCIENPENGKIEEIAAGMTNSRGKVVFRFDTKTSIPLPFDAANITLLIGQQIEIRTTSGEVVLSGVIPDA